MAQQVAVMGLAVGLGIAGLMLLHRKLRGRKKEPVIPPDHGAFVLRFQVLPPPFPPPPAAPPPLSGKTFAVKDIFDVEGYITGFGNPSWAATHSPAAHTAPCVQDVIREGATLEGKTHMDDMGYSMMGRSSLVGQPVNPRAPEHFPGGSSSGSAVAVAANLVDFALGTDTAGSIRIPAANCCVLGFRPTHGAVSAAGVILLAPSLDTVGVLARDPGVLHRVGHILLRQPLMQRRPPQRVIIADDLFDLSSCPRAPVTEPLIAVTERYLGFVVKYLKVGELLAKQVPSLAAFAPVPAGGRAATANGEVPRGATGSSLAPADALQALAEAQRLLQRLEFRDAHGAWVAATTPALHSHVAQRVRSAAEGVVLEAASDPAQSSGEGTTSGAEELVAAREAPADSGAAGSVVTRARIVETEEEKTLRAKAVRLKAELRQVLNDVLKDDALLVLPPAPDLPLPLTASAEELDAYRSKAMRLVSLSSMSGLPQVVIPVGKEPGRSDPGRRGEGRRGGLPLSVSLMARSGADRFLLDCTCLYAPVLPEAYLELLATRRLNASAPEGANAGEASSSGGSGGATAGSSRPQNGEAPKSPAETAKDNGNAAFKEKQYERAVDYYSEAIRLDPRNPTYYANRAMAHLNLRNMVQVEADCSAALELDKKNVKAFLRRGTAREFMGMYAEAYQDFQDAMILEPTNKTAIDGMRRIEQAGVLQ